MNEPGLQQAMSGIQLVEKRLDWLRLTPEQKKEALNRVQAIVSQMKDLDRFLTGIITSR